MNRTSDDTEIRIGTRGSRLAVIQADYVKRRIEASNPNVRISLVRIKTTADKVQDSPLYRIGGKGLFLKEIEEALLDGRIDLAVHSMKDVPVEIADVFEIAAITEREDPRDALISKDSLASFEQLPKGARVGTGSLRRSSQLMHIRPDVQILPIRGNQDTRLRKMKTEDMDAIVLAMAGIHRRDFKNIHVCPLNVDVCLPAGGQGSLGVEIRRHDENVSNLTRPLNDPKASMCIRAERACLHRLEAECYTPVSAYGEITNSKIHLRALVADLSGKRVVKGELVGDPNDPESLGSELASRLLRKGAEEILKELKKQSRTL